MIPYWILFGSVAIGALHFGSRDRARAAPYLAAVLVAITVFVGLRYQVGGDWTPYQIIFDNIYLLPFGDALRQTDIGYAFVNWLGAQLGADVWFPNLACAAMVSVGMGRLCLRQPNPFLALLVAVPYFFIVVAMGYTRQAAAIGLVCMALTSRSPHRIVKTVLWIGAAATMHKTALLILPLILIPVLRRNVLAAFAGLLFFAVAFTFALRDSVDIMMASYVEGTYDSQGAFIRVSMNVISAVVYLAFRRRFGFSSFDGSYWTTTAILALLSFVALLVAPSSSGIDRLSLFLIPLQVVVLSRLPYVFGKTAMNREVLVAVVLYCALVQGIWLFAAAHAELWLPYRIVVEQWAFG